MRKGDDTNDQYKKKRQYLATVSLRNGCEIKDIAEVLGHKRIETTEKYYISSTIENRKKATKLFEEGLKFTDFII